jgi:DNA polymerase
MPRLYLDFETRSTVDLPACGAYVYADHPSTRILCAAYAVEDGPVQLIPYSRDLDRDRVLSTGFGGMLVDPDIRIVARNAEFEKNIIRGVLGLDLPASKFICTAAQSARAGLPRSLEASGAVLGSDEQKDAVTGRRVIMKLCKPRRPSKANPDLFWEPHTAAEDYKALYEYCMQDVRTDREIHKSLPPIGESEQAIWELTVRMNDRGVKVDTAAVPLAMSAAAAETQRLAARWYDVTGVEHGSVVAGAEAVGLPDLTKATVRTALSGDLDPHVREALEIRQKIAKSSLAKLQAFLDRTSADGRIRGNLVYSGAERTARWSGYGVQPQNFPRGLGLETDAAFAALHAGELEGVAEGDVLGTVSDMLRGFFQGPFLTGDYAQIEARGLAWLAQQDDLVAAFARGEDVYCQMASAIWNTQVRKGDKDPISGVDMRFVGKTAVLGCGFGMGAAKFKSQLADQFGVTVSEAFSQKVIQAYRSKYAKIQQLWYRLEDAFRYAIRVDAKKLTHPGLRGLSVGVRQIGGRRFAGITLPSGREMLYFDPKVSSDNRISYIGRNIYAGGRWERVDTYGGKLTENVVQALSRDVMAEALVRLDKAGFPLVLTIHDEAVAECGEERMAEFEKLMAQRPLWAPDLPVAVECGAMARYRK